jgi:hypothetical protein
MPAAVNRTTTFVLGLLAALLLALPTPSAAKSAPRRGGQMLSFWGVLDPGPVDGIGVGGRAMLPLAPQGILQHPRIKDELTLELGADLVHYSDRVGYPYYVDYSWNGFLPVVGATWNFWFTPDLALYPKLDVGYWFGWYRGWDDRYGRSSYGGAFLQGAVGLIYRLQAVSLRVELGSGLLRLGAGFAF